MRDIKFRAWDKTNNKFLKSHEINLAIGISGDVLFSDNTPPFNEHGEIELTQWTGVTDCEGVDVYEGDVILTADDIKKKEIGNWKPKTRCIEWTSNKEYKTGFNIGHAQDRKCQVIGNIYENPELLEPSNA